MVLLLKKNGILTILAGTIYNFTGTPAEERTEKQTLCVLLSKKITKNKTKKLHKYTKQTDISTSCKFLSFAIFASYSILQYLSIQSAKILLVPPKYKIILCAL